MCTNFDIFLSWCNAGPFEPSSSSLLRMSPPFLDLAPLCLIPLPFTYLSRGISATTPNMRLYSVFFLTAPHGFIHVNCLIFAGIGSGLHCWQILIFTYAYALIFIHRRFGSLFWLLGVLIGSLFHKKMGPYWVLISKLGGPY